MRPSDAAAMRRLCIRMAAAGYGSMEYFMGLPIDALCETVREVADIVEKQRIRIGNKNSR